MPRNRHCPAGRRNQIWFARYGLMPKIPCEECQCEITFKSSNAVRKNREISVNIDDNLKLVCQKCTHIFPFHIAAIMSVSETDYDGASPSAGANAAVAR